MSFFPHCPLQSVSVRLKNPPYLSSSSPGKFEICFVCGGVGMEVVSPQGSTGKQCPGMAFWLSGRKQVCIATHLSLLCCNGEELFLPKAKNAILLWVSVFSAEGAPCKDHSFETQKSAITILLWEKSFLHMLPFPSPTLLLFQYKTETETSCN